MIDNELDTIEKKVLNIKIYEEDFNLIKIAVMIAIQNTNKNINNLEIDNELKLKLQKNANEYKKLLSKLEICKLYNENINN